jgi:hypothetical protein
MRVLSRLISRRLLHWKGISDVQLRPMILGYSIIPMAGLLHHAHIMAPPATTRLRPQSVIDTWTVLTRAITTVKHRR